MKELAASKSRIGMKYEEAPVKHSVSKSFVKDSDNKVLGRIGTFRILVHLYKRHELEILYGVVAVSWFVAIYINV